MRVLIVEDDESLADGLSVGLRLSGLTPELVTTIADAREAVTQGGFAAILLDIMLPDGTGLDFLSDLRSRADTTPVLLLTALDQVQDRVMGLDAGADDYLGKPFDLDEVLARLRAIVRRAEGRADAALKWNGLDVDPARMSARMQGQSIEFSPREFAILRALLERPGAILSKSLLEDRLYGWQDGVESNAVEVHVHKLRAKLGADFIQTVRGAGYRLAKDRS
ncbi:DNA-binding response regulator, OmpR family, contains REC and winged-helix (wHTH) domain [Roseovarius lutimaris]|uniref:DNA-binding response regulator, OmpR family, contains REC and winged-helix (WHTH) domain n=1 Tax=Roseovarius lutimaris TaxID=1005928 RepID=A0A1I4YWT5_9RHOB|nr:response regulator transcription factor [Roseovarius lutimaris]SFN42481.1 DNA-binding response regulator, OmpR family, contains REC and winged-helix (wHTH) domain [Roseovarius lutimaris]